ncbi:MAG TPA: hypothetical protein VHY20_10990 [Pirellulales bacterium]|nr:hypothetical protein [Pirellulales bacterium]
MDSLAEHRAIAALQNRRSSGQGELRAGGILICESLPATNRCPYGRQSRYHANRAHPQREPATCPKWVLKQGFNRGQLNGAHLAGRLFEAGKNMLPIDCVRQALAHYGAMDWLRVGGGAVMCYFFYVLLLRRPE